VRRVVPLTLFVIAATALAQAKSEGEEAAGPAKALPTLEDRIPPVSGNLFDEKGKFEIGLDAVVSLADPFYSKVLGSLYLSYHFAETVSIGVRLAGGYNWVSGAAVTCTPSGCTTPAPSTLNGAPGNIPFLGALMLQWAPVYGKLNLLAEAVLHFDAYISVGAAYVADSLASFPLAAVVAIGQRYIFGPHLTVKWELSDYMYSAGSPTPWFNHQLLLSLGVSFFVG
jgi:outer membrane beta-barrel protein